MQEYRYLNKIDYPADLKKLEVDKLPDLCDEIRDFLVHSVSKTGGHLASNIGAVELSVGMHYVFDSPKDHLMFDVGHQAYVHKILTGRKSRFNTLRKLNGISGFLKPDESEHDCFVSGHSSNSISAVLGMARADKLKGIDSYSVALIGDGALSGGMAYEALNDAGCSGLPIIVILNDNDMSISKSVGGLAYWLSNLRLTPKYFSMKERTVNLLKKFGKLGGGAIHIISSIKDGLRRQVLPENIFTPFGFEYLGPADGNDIDSVISLLTQAKKINKPVVVHFKTIKGKGYRYSEAAPDEYHSVSSFDTCDGKKASNADSFSSVFGDTLVSLAEKDNKICAITAAMDMGTGLTTFKNRFPDRFFDVGIAEQHAVTMSAGLAKSGAIPVCAVYSTFMQRAYDQLLHDVALNNSHVVLGIDRSGSVGSDGPTHHGLFDTSYLRSVPGMTIYAPSSYDELRTALCKSIYDHNGPVAIKYSRGQEGLFKNNTIDEVCSVIKEGTDVTILSYGILINETIKSAQLLDEEGISAEIVKINRLDLIDNNIIKESVSKTGCLVVCEEYVEAGGIGEAISAMLLTSGISTSVKLINFKDSFAEIGTVSQNYQLHGLSGEKIAATTKTLINEKGKINE